MSFFSAIKNAFGFGPDNDFEYDADTCDDADAPEAPTVANDTSEAVEGLTEVPTLPEIDTAMKARIFEGVVAVFNSNLPDFLAKSVDPEAQSRLLAETLDKDIDNYLSGLMLVAEQYAEAKLKGATENALRESERLRSDMQQIEQQRTSLREQQLSADRRRRALADRVNDLEAQLASVEAEREQFELENRSLLNKLKVADIQPGVVEEMSREIERLKALAEGKEQPAAAADTAELEAARAEAQKLSGELADIRTQQEMSQAMYNDMQNQYAAEREARIAAEKSLDEARKIIESVAEIQSQMEQVEEVIRKRDQRIEKLKTNNKKLREQLAAADNALKAARAMRDDGLFALADAERQSDAPGSITAEHMTAIEDEFECPDWFVSQPAPGEVSPLLQPDSEFGYQEPPKKPKRPENDAQLSLF